MILTYLLTYLLNSSDNLRSDPADHSTNNGCLKEADLFTSSARPLHIAPAVM